MDEKLIRFVDHAKDKGMDLATIRQLLLSAGWKEKDIAEVFCTRDLELPIPEPTLVGPARARGPRATGSVWPRAGLEMRFSTCCRSAHCTLQQSA